MDPQLELDSILLALRGASLEEQAEIGRGDLASLLHVAPPQLVDKIIKMATRQPGQVRARRLAVLLRPWKVHLRQD